MNELTAPPKKYAWKGSNKQKLAMELWTNPTSESFGNAYKSFLNAGFSPSYSKNIVGQAPRWISEYLDRLDFTDEHIKQGIQEIAMAAPNSRSPDDTRLKGFELLAKIRGMIDNKHSTTNVIVQPILSGLSQNPAQAKKYLNSTIVEEHTDTDDSELVD